MAIYRGTGGSTDTTDQATVTEVTELAAEAASSAAEAATSATTATSKAATATTASNSASSYASQAITAASQAQTSSTAASGYSSDASDSADAAAASATAAASSATGASTSASTASSAATTATNKATEAAASASSAASSYTNVVTVVSGVSDDADAAAASATAAATSETNAAASETAAATSETNAASSATAASSSATAAASSETAAAGSATAAASSATAAAASESAAATSETNAGTSETNAANSATVASNSASAAATSATNAATSETNAAASETAAAASQTAANAAKDAALAALDSFDDRYLGTKTSDPTLDNDGNALVAGALYFNTTDDVMKVYEGSSWVAAYASLSGALLQSNNLSDLPNAATARTNLGLGTAATTASTDYATAAQGALADSAIQAADLGTAAYTASTAYATAAQGALADSALQSYTETDPVYTASSWYTTTNNSSNWNTAYGWGNHASAGYITDYTVTEGDVTAHEAALTIAQSQVTGLSTALAGKVDDSQVLTNVPSGAVFTDTTYSVGNGGLTEINFTSARSSKLDGIATNANNYTHPSYAGDDINLDTGALSGATVISDLDFNVTTDTLGHVTDANATYSTRNLTAANIGAQPAGTYNTIIGTDSDINTSGATIIDNLYMTDGVITSHGTRTLTLADLGFTGETNATADQSASEILTLLKTVDGSGSGLDADLLDGISSGSFVRSDADDTKTGYLDVNNTVYAYRGVGDTHTDTSQSGTQTPDFSRYQNFVWTLTGNVTLGNAGDEAVGQSGVFVFIHSGAARTVSLSSDYESVGGAGLTLSGAAGATDIVPYFVAATNRIILGTPQLAFS